MKNYYLHKYKTEQWLPINIHRAWDFFSSPMNLAKITPPELDFKVQSSHLSNSICSGMLIDYTIKPLFGIQMKWKTEIVNVAEGRYFTDKQIKGPYTAWEHTHYFEERSGGVLMTDIVHYQLPFGVIGLLLHHLLIRSRIESIFSYRTSRLKTLFAS
jgi:ligand-binding SRPBCC domain-containing protein